MTSSNGNIFRIIGHFWGEPPVGSPHKGQWRGDLMFSALQQTVEWTIETPMIWDAIAVAVTSLLCGIFDNRFKM